MGRWCCEAVRVCGEGGGVRDLREAGQMKQRGRAHRSKTGKSSGCVRFDDLNGLKHKFNKTGFRTDEEIGLFYDFIKRYEQELRAEGGGTGAGAGTRRKERLNYPSVAQSTSLKLLPEGFRDFTNKKKVDSLKELCEALVSENAPRIVEQDEVGRPNCGWVWEQPVCRV